MDKLCTRCKSKLTEIVSDDLKALLFWATIGVTRSIDGEYSNEIRDIIESYSEHLHFKLPHRPKFKIEKRYKTK